MSSSIRVFNSLQHLLNKNTSAFKYNYANKILLKKSIDNNSQYIQSWQSKCLVNFYFQEFYNYNKIFTLDFKINNDILKINNLSINNDYYDKKLDLYLKYNFNHYDYNKYKNKLTDEETLQIKKFIYDYIMNYSKNNNIKKITIDIHRNFERYNLELKEEGFIPNYEIKWYSNPYWIQVEKYI